MLFLVSSILFILHSDFVSALDARYAQQQPEPTEGAPPIVSYPISHLHRCQPHKMRKWDSLLKKTGFHVKNRDNTYCNNTYGNTLL